MSSKIELTSEYVSSDIEEEMTFSNIIWNTFTIESGSYILPENIDNKNTRYLYMDCFGDIVTDDGLIIMPGICNPLLFDANVTAYNPYTVASDCKNP